MVERVTGVSPATCPSMVRYASPSAARVENGKLTVRFGKAKADAPPRESGRRERAR